MGSGPLGTAATGLQSGQSLGGVASTMANNAMDQSPFLKALNAVTGTSVPHFGESGQVDPAVDTAALPQANPLTSLMTKQAQTPSQTPTVVDEARGGPVVDQAKVAAQADTSGKAYPVAVKEAGPGYTTYQMSDGTVVRRKGDFAWRNNNPGNIEDGKFTQSQPGYIPGGGRFAAFDTVENGLAAREKLMFNSPSYTNLTLSQAISRWAPPSENNTSNYISQLAQASGVDPNTKMRDIPPAQRQAILQAQMRVEGNKPGQEFVLGKGNVPTLVAQNPSTATKATRPTQLDAMGKPIPQMNWDTVGVIAQPTGEKPSTFERVAGALLGGKGGHGAPKLDLSSGASSGPGETGQDYGEQDVASVNGKLQMQKQTPGTAAQKRKAALEARLRYQA